MYILCHVYREVVFEPRFLERNGQWISHSYRLFPNDTCILYMYYGQSHVYSTWLKTIFIANHHF